jgi:dihydropteroate synthase
MDYALSGDVDEMLERFFAEAHAGLSEVDLATRAWADPCFGFGKSRAQNLSLMETLPALMDRSPWRRWVWGVSRKSFLRDERSTDPRDPITREVLDARQLAWARRSLEKLREAHTIVLRAHAPATLAALRT